MKPSQAQREIAEKIMALSEALDELSNDPAIEGYLDWPRDLRNASGIVHSTAQSIRRNAEAIARHEDKAEQEAAEADEEIIEDEDETPSP